MKDQHSACVVRLEADAETSNKFASIAALQWIAATIIPDLVPQNLQLGKAKNAQGRMFRFSVIEFVEGDLLDDIWQQLSADEQRSIVTTLVEALEKLHSVRLNDKDIKETLAKALCEDDDEGLKSFEKADIFGGPHGLSEQWVRLIGLYHCKTKA